jgi:hypothetical protein
VRHPLERLLSAWRYMFESQGWRYIVENDPMANNNGSITDADHQLLSLSWPDFVSQVDQKSTSCSYAYFFNRSSTKYA